MHRALSSWISWNHEQLSTLNVKVLIKLKARTAHTRSERKTFFLQRGNARPRAILKTTECKAKFGGTVLSVSHTALTLHYQIFICLGLYKKDYGDSILFTTMLSWTGVKKWTATAGRVLPAQRAGSRSSLEKMH